MPPRKNAGGLAPPMGGPGQIVEADETCRGKVESAVPRSRGRIPQPTKGGNVGLANKRPIVALVEHSGRVRTLHVPVADKNPITENIARESRLHTDESRLYWDAEKFFASHETVRHSVGEYVRGDVHTNSAEGFFGIFKRGMLGIYQHCAEKHLHRYLAEYDFRYDHRVPHGIDGTRRTIAAVPGAEGMRLTYCKPDSSGLSV